MTGDQQKIAREAAPRKKTWFRILWDWIFSFAFAAAAVFFVTTFLAEPIRVDGRSMQNTLRDGDLMVATKLDYWLSDPERFDVVICHYPDEGSARFVKRIVGLPGDTVRIADGVLYLNGEAQQEDYIEFRPNYTLPETTVEPGRYFVLGDNRASSMDSHIVGQLERDDILGHVQLVLWPLDEIRVIR